MSSTNYPKDHPDMWEAWNNMLEATKDLKTYQGNVLSWSRWIDLKKEGYEAVDGHFECGEGASMASLAGSPIYVSKSFTCTKLGLTTLMGGPKYVGGSYSCYDNMLTDLNGLPEFLFVSLVCRNNKLKDFKGCPRIVVEGIYAHFNQIKSFEGVAEYIGGEFWFGHNDKGLNLNHCPPHVRGSVDTAQLRIAVGKWLHTRPELTDIFHAMKLELDDKRTHMLEVAWNKALSGATLTKYKTELRFSKTDVEKVLDLIDESVYPDDYKELQEAYLNIYSDRATVLEKVLTSYNS